MSLSFFYVFVFFFFFEQKTAYEWRISDWISDVCSSDLSARGGGEVAVGPIALVEHRADVVGQPVEEERATVDARGAQSEVRAHPVEDDAVLDGESDHGVDEPGMLGRPRQLVLGLTVALAVDGHREAKLMRARGHVGLDPAEVFAALVETQRDQIGRAHVLTPVTNAHLVCRLLLEKTKKQHKPN